MHARSPVVQQITFMYESLNKARVKCFAARMFLLGTHVFFYLCVLSISLQSHVWIKRLRFDMVPNGLSVRPLLRAELQMGLGLLSVHLVLCFSSHCQWTCPCSVLSLPVGGAVNKVGWQLMPLWHCLAALLSWSPSQDLDLMAILLR